MLHSIAADLIVIIHLGFIAFVVTGAFLVRRWPWVFYLHAPALIWAAVIEFLNLRCPLTPLENTLRIAAGEEAYSGGFIETYILPLIYPGEITREVQIGLGALVILINVVIYGWIIIKRDKIRR